jgi:hypothetical protein
MYGLAGGSVRFGISTAALKRGDELRNAAKMSSAVWRRLEKTGKKLKANPVDWLGHVGSIALNDVTVEVMDANMTWHCAHQPHPDASLRKGAIEQGTNHEAAE